MPCHRANHDLVARFAYVAEPANTANINQQRGLRQAQLHGGQKTMAAGEDLGVFARRQKIQGFAKRTGRFVVEVRRDHKCLLPDTAFAAGFLGASAGAPEDWADRIAFQTRSGLSGISMWRMPRGESASQTALTTQGVDAMVPASPTPFTPIGLTGDGVTVRSRMNSGSRWALGRA